MRPEEILSRAEQLSVGWRLLRKTLGLGIWDVTLLLLGTWFLQMVTHAHDVPSQLQFKPFLWEGEWCTYSVKSTRFHISQLPFQENNMLKLRETDGGGDDISLRRQAGPVGTTIFIRQITTLIKYHLAFPLFFSSIVTMSTKLLLTRHDSHDEKISRSKFYAWYDVWSRKVCCPKLLT